MAQFLVRDIDEAVSRRFVERARREGKSAEELARELITRHANETRERAARRLEEIRLSTVGTTTIDPVELIRADRDGDHAG
jgi:plasmid stability protein